MIEGRQSGVEYEGKIEKIQSHWKHKSCGGGGLENEMYVHINILLQENNSLTSLP